MFDLEPDEARLLLNIALMAIGRNRFRSAETIISALEGYRANSEQLAVTRVIMGISKVELDEALKFIDDEALVKFPASAMLKAFKGMILMRLNRTGEAQAILREAAEQSVDPAAAQLAKDMLI